MRPILHAILLSFVLCFAFTAKAQPDLTWGTPIQYSFLLLDHPTLEGVEYQYYPGTSSAFTKLYLPEMKKFSMAFISYARTMRSVRNYVGPLGTKPPEALGSYKMDEAIELIGNGKLERIGHSYFDLSGYNQYVTVEGETLLLDGKPFYADNTIFKGKDTVYTEDIHTGEMSAQVVENSQIYDEVMAGVGFIEEWEYDKNKAQFYKDIKYLSVLQAYRDQETQEYRGLQYVMTFKAGKFGKRYLGDAGLIRKDVEYNVLFNRDFNIDCDAGDYPEGMARSPFANGYIQPDERFGLLMELAVAVRSGQLSVYQYDPIDFNINKLTKAAPDAFFQAMTKEHEAITEDLLTGELMKTTITTELHFEDVIGIRFFEDWYMDPDNFGMYKRVNGIVLLMEAKDPSTGLVRGVTPFVPFYIQLNTRM
jgi:hypothetical protein